MKSICLALVLALCSTGCSGFSKSARADRAYRKYIRASTAERTKRRKQFTERQRSEMASLRKTPPTVEQQASEQTPEQPSVSTQENQ